MTNKGSRNCLVLLGLSYKLRIRSGFIQEFTDKQTIRRLGSQLKKLGLSSDTILKRSLAQNKQSKEILTADLANKQRVLGPRSRLVVGCLVLRSI